MSAVTLDSTRFGAVQIAAESVIEFSNGLIGLGGSRYALLTSDAGSPFAWLHSMEDADVALPVTNPWLFFSEFAVDLSDGEAERLGVRDPNATDVWVTVRAASRLEDFSANLRAPILVWNGKGHQVINEAQNAPVRAPLFPAAMTEQVVAA
jgi:flagellar assembly factor FliW